jgi:hypothetical protein
MNASSNNWPAGVLGVLIGSGIVSIFLLDATPFAGATGPLVDFASLSRIVGEFTGFGFAVALLAFGLKRLVERVLERHPSAEQEAPVESVAPVKALAIATPRTYDATASDLDGPGPAGFAPVVCLTEAQVDRARARRVREERRSAPQSA